MPQVAILNITIKEGRKKLCGIILIKLWIIFSILRNVGEIENPDGVGEVGSLACGDALKLTFKLDKNGKIEDAKFKTFGCASAIASSSVLTELIKGKTIEEAAKVTNKEIADYLGGLPSRRCTAL